MTGGALPSFSVVINTLDRADMLRRSLRAFDWIDYDGDFEIIVVNGPSRDATQSVLDEFAARIRVASCPEPNLSMSRNIGLRAARGDIVAFIDDDGLPEKEWFTDLAAVYSDPEVGAAGGFVYDHTGTAFQYRYGTADRLARAYQSDHTNAPYAFPGAFAFPHLLGTNSTFRRDLALSLGGFDEEYEYFLDETDLLVRVLDSGASIRQVEGAYVHHKFAPSSMRSTNRVARNRRSLLKNHTYFVLRHATEHRTSDEIDHDIATYAAQQRDEMEWAAENGLIEQDDLDAFEAYADEAVATGRAHARAAAALTPLDGETGDLVSHPAARVSRRRHVIVAASPAADDTAAALEEAARVVATGDTAAAIVATADTAHVDFVDGVWEHRIRASSLTWELRADEELASIGARRTIDAVERLTPA